MNWGVMRKGIFWIAMILFALPIASSLYFSIGKVNSTFIIVMFVLVLVYYFHYVWSLAHISNERIAEISRYYDNKDKENIERILSLAEVVNSFSGIVDGQKIRSNVFLKSDEFDGYQIYAHYNMNNCTDLKVRIPSNKGASGEAWLSKLPVWADKEHIFEGMHRIPQDERKKLDPNINWICSHPIIKNNETIAVFNIDGDRKIEDKALKEKIEKIARSIVNVLENYDLKILKRVNKPPSN